MAAKPIPNQMDLFKADSCPEEQTAIPKVESVAICRKCLQRYLTINEVTKRYSVSRATIWRWVARQGQFPAPVKLSSGTSRWKMSALVQFEKALEDQGYGSSTPLRGDRA